MTYKQILLKVYNSNLDEKFKAEELPEMRLVDKIICWPLAIIILVARKIGGK